MVADQPPAVIRDITPELRAIIGCAGLWADYHDMFPKGGDEAKNMEVYQGYMTRCLNGEPVAMRLRVKK